MRKTIYKIGLSIILILFLADCMNIVTYAKENTIKVGYFNESTFVYSYDSDGEGNSLTGFGYEYMNALAEQMNWDLEYIEVNSDERFESLKSGEIDILMPLQKLDKAKNYCEFSSYECTMVYNVLYVSKTNKELYFKDYENFNEKKIGVRRNTYEAEIFEDYTKQNGFEATKVLLSSAEDMQSALDNGDIDAFIMDSFSKTSKTNKIADVISCEPVYIAVQKSNTNLLNELNAAMVKLKRVSPYFQSDLSKKYFGSFTTYEPMYTREETAFIEEKKKLKAAIIMGTPYIAQKDDDGKYSGVIYDMMEVISDKLTIEFEYVDAETFDEAEKMVLEGKADFVVSGRPEAQNELVETTQYLDLQIMAVGSEGIVDSIATDKRINMAIAKGIWNSDNIMKLYFPNADITYFESLTECLDSIGAGKSDVTIISSIEANGFLKQKEYQNLVRIDLHDCIQKLAIQVPNISDKMLLNVLNKAIANIDNTTKDYIVLKSGTVVNRNFDILYILEEYGVVVVFIIIVVLSFAYVVHRKVIDYKDEEVRNIEFKDQLTKGYNAKRFKKEITKILISDTVSKYAIISMDIKRLKYINEGFGHETGDRIIINLFNILKSSLRNDEILARESADVFLIFIKDTGRVDIIDRILRWQSDIDAAAHEGTEVNKVSVAMGIYEINEDDSVDEIIDKANISRRYVKIDYRHNFAFYDKNFRDLVAKEMEIEGKMHKAIENREFVVYYQPKFDLDNKKMVGAEALVRWISDTEGVIEPNTFIPVFEKNGFIEELDFYVYNEVFLQISKWIERGVRLVPISVNASRKHLNSSLFADKIISLAREYNIPTGYVEIEITETVLQDKMVDVSDIIIKLKTAGFIISIDDFGAGYSSFNTLKEVPADIIKIDKEFIEEVEYSKRSREIVTKIIEMANNIDIEVICEGIEHEGQVEFLKSIGCKTGQGYIYAKPMPFSDFDNMIEERAE